MRWLFALVAALLVAAPVPVRAQLFFSSLPGSGFRIGPLLLSASVTPEPGPVIVDVLFSVMVRATGGPPSAPQDLYLLWPGEVRGDPKLGERDQPFARSVEQQGFDVIGEGRLPLFAQRQFASDGAAPTEAVAGGAPYVTFVQSGGVLGLSPPATWIRIPWTPKLVDAAWLMDLQITSPSLVKPKTATWIEDAVLGQRRLFAMSFNEVRDRPLFPMYLLHRDRVVRLADAPAQLEVNFADADRLKVDQVYPLNTIRRLSETRESTQVISLFLDTSDGLAPQQLSVQFGYFSRLQALALVAIPTLFLALGYAVGPVLGRMATRLGQHVAARVHVGGWNAAPRQRDSGVLIPSEVLARIRPGETTFEEVLRLCGADAEIYERLGSPGRRTVVYRGRRVRPQTRRLFGWLSTVRYLEVERHEVTIEIEAETVRDVQADVRRSRIPVGEKP